MKNLRNWLAKLRRPSRDERLRELITGIRDRKLAHFSAMEELDVDSRAYLAQWSLLSESAAIEQMAVNILIDGRE